MSNDPKQLLGACAENLLNALTHHENTSNSSQQISVNSSISPTAASEHNRSGSPQVHRPQRMYIYMYIYIYICIYICVYVCIYIYVYICVCVWTYAHIRARTRTRAHAYISKFLNIVQYLAQQQPHRSPDQLQSEEHRNLFGYRPQSSSKRNSRQPSSFGTEKDNNINWRTCVYSSAEHMVPYICLFTKDKCNHSPICS